jgi:pantetheine-phosphate adenylyltransferase
MDITPYYNEPHRYYHNLDHVATMGNAIFDAYCRDPTFSKHDFHLIDIAIELHDIVYDPRSDHNELDSCKFIEEFYKELSDNEKMIIRNAIMDTCPSAYNKKPSSKISEALRYGDLYPFITGNIGKLFENYRKLIKEFQFVPYQDFYKAHYNFIRNNIGKNCKNLWIRPDIIETYLTVIKNYKPSIGVYAGTFNPFHIGHLSVLEQAEKIFDKVIIARPIDPSVSRFKSVNHILPLHEVIEFDGLLVDLLTKLSSNTNITLVRGLRNGNDLEYEINMKRINEDFHNKIETVYFVTNLPHISSSVIRSLPGKTYEQYIPTKYDYLYK